MRNGLVGDITFTRKDHLLSNSSAEDDSPYPEVRSAVANTDDPSMPSSTIRSWTIGLIFAIVMAGINQFFFFRFPSVTISNVSTAQWDLLCRTIYA